MILVNKYNSGKEEICELSIKLSFKIIFVVVISFWSFNFFCNFVVNKVENDKEKFVMEKVIVIVLRFYLNLFIRGWLNKFYV